MPKHHHKEKESHHEKMEHHHEKEHHKEHHKKHHDGKTALKAKMAHSPHHKAK